MPLVIGPYFDGSPEFEQLAVELKAGRCPRCNAKLYPNRRCSRCKWQWAWYKVFDGKGWRIEAAEPKNRTIPDPGADPFGK